MKVMCIYPGAALPGFASLRIPGNNESNYMNHGLGMVSAVLKREGHEVWLLDLRGFQDWEHFENVISNDQEFDVALIDFMSCDATYAEKCLEICKKHHPTKPTIAGGIHLSVTQATNFPHADAVVLGEGEEIIVKILRNYQKTGSFTFFSSSKPVLDLDSLPFVDRNLFNNKMELETPLLPLLPTPFVTVVFSRGCPYRCLFCFPSRQLIAGKKKRIRSISNCLEELSLIKNSTGIGSLMIHDDLFPENTKWLEEFIIEFPRTLGRIPFWCQMRSSFVCKHPDIIKGLAKAGMTWASIGGESGSQRMLDFLKKGATVEQNIEAAQILHDNNINLFYNTILGLPTETKEDVEATGRMLKTISPAWHSLSIYTAYPGSQLYDYAIQNNLFTGDHYRMTRYPYEKKVKGIDYDYIFQKINEFSQYKSELREWKEPIVNTIHHNTTSTKQEIQKTALIRFINPTAISIKNNPPKVSIILTSHDRPKMLKEAIQSISKQTLSDWELIIVDSSSDQEIPLILNQAVKDKRIFLLYESRNVGNVGIISQAWNRALDFVQGEYICFLDDDNRKKPNFCKILSNYLDSHPNYDVVACLSEAIDENGSKLAERRSFPHPSGMTKETLLIRNYIDSGELMVRTQTIKKVGYFDERLTTNEDWDMIIRLLYETKGIAILEKYLADYRYHTDRRMHKTQEFNPKNIELVKSKKHGHKLSISYIHPPFNRLTLSQGQVCQAISDVLTKYDYEPDFISSVRIRNSKELMGMNTLHPLSPVDVNSDFILVAAPFQISLEEMQKLASYNIPIITIHMEDPQAILANRERDRFAEWVVTNDIGAMSYYQNIVNPDKVLFCPSLSVSPVSEDTRKGKYLPFDYKQKYDIMFCGYAYESRKQFMEEFLKLKPKCQILLVGDGWEQFHKIRNIETLPTQGESDTTQLYRSAKIVFCLHRTEQDIGGFPIMPPQSIHRGYIEVYSGALVMIDDKRSQHSFGPDEVVFFSSPKDLKKQIDYYLLHPRKAKTMAKRAQARATRDFTFRARLTKILNCVRSERYNTIIP